MKIVVATSGRAHLLDCARELQNQGHEVVFFTYSPKKKIKEYGLKKGGVSLLKYVAIFEFFKRKFYCLVSWRLSNYILDMLVYFLMPSCDVFIAQSPYYKRCLKKAKKKFNAITILDRGTSHVLTYNSILEKIGMERQWSWYINHDKSQYSLADYICIASDFVENSFIKNGFPKEKLFVNPYGVSLNNFYPTICTGEYDCICVGQWSKRKGSNLVVDAFSGTSIRVLHVGSIIDVDFPKDKNFVHIDSVSERELVEYYKKAKIFLFPSFEDGFGLVLCQAIACGLPIICSPNTGGPTLKKILNIGNEISIMKSFTSVSLMEEYTNMSNILALDKGMRTYVDKNILESRLSWNAYGNRYDNFLKRIMDNE